MKKMKLFSSLVLMFIIFISTLEIGFAQRIVKIANGQDFVAVIKADTTGRKANPGLTIYELARDGYFLATGTLTNTDYHLFIRAAGGTGPKPIIRPGVNTSTGASSRVFAPANNLTLQGVYLANKDNAAMPLTISNGIRPGKRGVRIVIDSCHIEFDVQSLVRMDADSMRVFISNSIIGNLGSMNGDNGRVADTRGNNQDTISIINNIIYNNSEKVLRTDNCRVNFIKFDHNTLVNCADGRIDFGAVVVGQFTNNLLINVGFLGRDKNSPNGSALAAVGPKAGYTQTFTIKNNNYYVDTAITNYYPKDSTKAGFSLAPYNKRFFLDSTITAVVTKAGSASGNDSLRIVFTKGPKSVKDAMLANLNTTIAAPNKLELDKGDGVSIEFEPHYVFDFTFPTSSPLYTRGSLGRPIGSLLDWKTLGGVNSVHQNGESQLIPKDFHLKQNYPNPFNPVTVIEYQIPISGMVHLKVYDILGREAAVLVSEVKSAGHYSVSLNASDLGSGIYLYKLQAGQFTETKKMILVK